MNGAATGTPPAPQLHLVAVRELFDSDAGWLRSLERVARTAATLRRLHLALQVRFEARQDGDALAQEALRRLRAAHPTLPLWLNARAGVEPRGYDGVHLPEAALSTPLAPHRLAWAASVHGREALQTAQRSGARFVLFGSLWKPQWKDAAPQGLEALRTLVQEATIPVVAIGGITPERVGPCLRAGAHGVAVASGVFRASDTRRALMTYVEALETAAS